MNAVILALKYLPLVLEAVLAIERIVGAGNGKEKKDLVLAAIQAAAQTGEKSDNATVQVVSTLVDQVVSILNMTGVFGKQPKAA